jgi:hypothetical protein
VKGNALEQLQKENIFYYLLGWIKDPEARVRFPALAEKKVRLRSYLIEK